MPLKQPEVVLSRLEAMHRHRFARPLAEGCISPAPFLSIAKSRCKTALHCLIVMVVWTWAGLCSSSSEDRKATCQGALLPGVVTPGRLFQPHNDHDL